MENVHKQELCTCQKRDKYARIHKALEKCAFVDEDYAKYLLFMKDGGVGYGGDNPSCTCNDVEDDPQYMNFLANTKPHGTSYVSKFVDENGLPVFIKYEEDGESEIHGVGKSQDDVRGKYKMGESSKGLKDDARENRELEIHGGEKGQDSVKEKYKLGEGSKGLQDNAREDRKLEIRGVEKGQDSVREKYKLEESSKGRKVNVRENWMKDGVLSKKQGNEDKDLVNRKHIDAEVKIEPEEDSDSFKEAISQSEVEILENVGAEVGRGSSSNPFVPSVEHRLNLDATIIDSRYRKEVVNLLMRPYNDEEYKKLWKDIKRELPSSSTNGRGKSFLSLHKDVNRAIKRTNHNKDKKLNIMRGFFFWLEHLTRQDAFQPWEDEECLRTMPGSS